MRARSRTKTFDALRAAALAASLACGLQPPAAESTPQQPPPPPPPAGDVVDAPPPGLRLVWSDEFDGAALDPAKWRNWVGPRREAVVSDDAVEVKDGVLRLRVFTEGGVHHVGFLGSDGRFEARYGYFEARIRFTSAPGEWCAFWLFAPTIGTPVGDPATAGTEIDVVEHRFTDDGGWQLRDWVSFNLNWDGYGKDRKIARLVTQLPGGAPVQGEWHTYAVLWEPSGYTFSVDGVPLWHTAQAVSARSEWLQLTCEVLGGANWAGFVPAGGYGSRAASTTGMEVDWVRAWQAP